MEYIIPTLMSVHVIPANFDGINLSHNIKCISYTCSGKHGISL